MSQPNHLSNIKFNNFVVKTRGKVKQVLVRMCHKMTREIKKYRNSKADSEEVISKKKKKANRLTREMKLMKKLKKDDITKFAVQFDKKPDSILNDLKAHIKLKVLVKISQNEILKRSVNEFRQKYPNWKVEIPNILRNIELKKTGMKLNEAIEKGEADRLSKYPQVGNEGSLVTETTKAKKTKTSDESMVKKKLKNDSKRNELGERTKKIDTLNGWTVENSRSKLKGTKVKQKEGDIKNASISDSEEYQDESEEDEEESGDTEEESDNSEKNELALKLSNALKNIADNSNDDDYDESDQREDDEDKNSEDEFEEDIKKGVKGLKNQNTKKSHSKNKIKIQDDSNEEEDDKESSEDEFEEEKTKRKMELIKQHTKKSNTSKNKSKKQDLSDESDSDEEEDDDDEEESSEDEFEEERKKRKMELIKQHTQKSNTGKNKSKKRDLSDGSDEKEDDEESSEDEFEEERKKRKMELLKQQKNKSNTGKNKSKKQDLSDEEENNNDDDDEESSEDEFEKERKRRKMELIKQQTKKGNASKNESKKQDLSDESDSDEEEDNEDDEESSENEFEEERKRRKIELLNQGKSSKNKIKKQPSSLDSDEDELEKIVKRKVAQMNKKNIVKTNGTKNTTKNVKNTRINDAGNKNVNLKNDEKRPSKLLNEKNSKGFVQKDAPEEETVVDDFFMTKDNREYLSTVKPNIAPEQGDRELNGEFTGSNRAERRQSNAAPKEIYRKGKKVVLTNRTGTPKFSSFEKTRNERKFQSADGKPKFSNFDRTTNRNESFGRKSEGGARFIGPGGFDSNKMEDRRSGGRFGGKFESKSAVGHQSASGGTSEKLHPSWEAKKRHQPVITHFKGKKIKFDE